MHISNFSILGKRFCFSKSSSQNNFREVCAFNLTGDLHSQTTTSYCDNYIRSSRYKWHTFPFICLYEQMQYVTNIYFAALALINLLISKRAERFLYTIPIIVLLGIGFIKCGVEDIFRHLADAKINNVQYLCLEIDFIRRELKWKHKRASEIRVGDVVCCMKNQSFPCDLVILASSDETTRVDVTTVNLDGENNVKKYYALSHTQPVYAKYASNNLLAENVHNFYQTLKEMFVLVNCQNPTEDLNSFEGRYSWGDVNDVPLTVSNLAPRGAKLHITKYMIGVSVYTGDDTKLSLNCKQRERKHSSNAVLLNSIILCLTGVIIVFCILFTILSVVTLLRTQSVAWYINHKPLTAWRVCELAFEYFNLSNTMIPISMICTIELVQSVLSYFISSDMEMYDPDLDLCSAAKTTRLTDELGQVKFLFSDKTGTLTKNEMRLHCFGLVRSQELVNCADSGNGNLLDPIRRSSECEHFLTICALCHTVDIDISEGYSESQHSRNHIYKSISADEDALVRGAARNGVVFAEKNPIIDQPGSYYLCIDYWSDKLNEPSTWLYRKKYIIDAILEFDAIRKRMTVMARHPDGTHHIHSKGAETTMLDNEKCTTTCRAQTSVALQFVTDFATQGFRPLVFATRKVDEQMYNTLLSKWRNMSTYMGAKRNQAMKIIHEEIECAMEPIGVTGVEDKLQPGVKECIQSMREAGIVIWVLTGDKEETAVSVCQTAGHFSQTTSIIRVTGCNSEKSVYSKIHTELRRYDHSRKANTPDSKPLVSNAPVEEEEERILSLVVDGESLKYALKPEVRLDFMKLCLLANAVLCCRATPIQKASVVKLVQDSLASRIWGLPSATTAAIGDGGNDVAMILQANIGLAVYGKEGLEAARASDYALTQFRHLTRLFFVHGFWADYRISYVVLYHLHRCVILTTMNVLYACYTDFTPRKLTSFLAVLILNLWLLAFVILIYGIFERVISAKVLLKNPQLYQTIAGNANLNLQNILLWFLDGIWQGSIVFFVPYFCLVGGQIYGPGIFYDGSTHIVNLFDYDLFSCSALICGWATIVFQLLIWTRDYSLIILLSLAITASGIPIYAVFQFVISARAPEFHNFTKLPLSPSFLFTLLVCVFAANLPMLVWRTLSDNWWMRQISKRPLM